MTTASKPKSFSLKDRNSFFQAEHFTDLNVVERMGQSKPQYV